MLKNKATEAVKFLRNNADGFEAEGEFADARALRTLATRIEIAATAGRWWSVLTLCDGQGRAARDLRDAGLAITDADVEAECES